MPIKNYTTIVPANRSISEIQDSLVKYGATGMLYKYEQGTGRIEALQFLLRIKNHDVAFSLPVHWRRFQRVLELQQVRRWDEEAYVYLWSAKTMSHCLLLTSVCMVQAAKDQPGNHLHMPVTIGAEPLHKSDNTWQAVRLLSR
jgi:hypothetical protein